MGIYRFSTLRRVLDCPAQFLLAAHDVDTSEMEVDRAGHQAMEEYCRKHEFFSSPMSAERAQLLMDHAASRVVLADERQTDALRRALRSLPPWFGLPARIPYGEVLTEQPIYVVIDKLHGADGCLPARPATSAEIAAGTGPVGGWLYRSTVDYAVLASKDSGRHDVSVIVEWNFARTLDNDSIAKRFLGRGLYALAVWIAHGEWEETLECVTVYPFLGSCEVKTFRREDFALALSDLHGLLQKADEVLATAPANSGHARPGPRCATCPVSQVCPAVDVAVRAMRGDPASWVVKAEEWIVLRRYMADMEAYLREKARADGPIPTSHGFEVGYRGERFGVFRQGDAKGDPS